MKSVFVYRTHRFDAHDAAELERLSRAGMSIVVAADERRGTVETQGFAKVALTEDSIGRLGLASHPDVGWLCGDYVLYLAAEAVPDADTYWLMERDVRINFDDPREFFSSFEDIDSDYLSVRHELAPDRSYWRPRIEPFRRPAYQSLFGILRISRRAIEHLLPIRRSMRDVPRNVYPNDESFVASVLANDGFACGTLRERIDFFPNRSFALRRVVSGAMLDAKPRDNLVHHAVLYGEEFAEKALRMCQQFPTVNRLSEVIDGVSLELGPERAAAFAAQLAAGS